MAKVWVNPVFKDKVKDIESSDKKDKISEKIVDKSLKKKRPKIRGKLSPQTKNAIHSDNYFNKRIQENTLVEFVFVNSISLVGTIEWVDQRYIKLIEAKTGDNVLIDRKHIKYVKKKEII